MAKFNHTVTVLMPVYNGGKYLNEAIESILGQIYTDFEFLIIDDGSTDNSSQIIKSYSDPRIRILDNEKNLGLAHTLNRGIASARGKYIARMDCDDIALPSRLGKQVSYMDAHPGVGVCGSWIRVINTLQNRVWAPPVDSESIKCKLLFGSPFAHSSVMIRRDAFLNLGLKYDPLYPHAEDYQLWVNAAVCLSLANIPEILLFYRNHRNQVGRVHQQEQLSSAQKIRINQLHRLGLNPKPEDIGLHDAISERNFIQEKEFVAKTEFWLKTLRDANNTRKVYHKATFDDFIAHYWLAICRAASGCGLWVPKQYWKSSLQARKLNEIKSEIKFTVDCIIRTCF